MRQLDKTMETIMRELIRRRIKTPEDLALAKRRLSKKYKVPLPSNASLLKSYHEMVKNGTTPPTEERGIPSGKFFRRFHLRRQSVGVFHRRNRNPHQDTPVVERSSLRGKRLDTEQGFKPSKTLEKLLVTRPIRSLSGIVNVSVLTKPYPCPGKCLYCPAQKGVPKSYLNNEPAVMRAIQNKYDPYKQAKTRLESLENTGHVTDKIELRIIGGTWSYYPKRYREWFITRCFAACNAELRGTRRRTTRNIISLKKGQKRNEKTKHRIVGLSIETRPDFINKEEIKHLRKLGVTMVELGVQTIYDDVLEKNLRGHKAKDTISATKLLKDAGFKVLYQMMPNLPGSNLKKDLKVFNELFSNPDFQPDLLKIYPCAILKEAPLYKLWESGKYKPYSKKELVDLVKKIKKIIPYYVRIQRITRDIPSQSIVAGPAKISNLRQVLAENAKKEKWQCKCIRCREIKGDYNPREKLCLFRENYNASEGKEIFLSFENKTRNKIFSLLRVRIPSPDKGIRTLRDSAIIREIHTYGQVHPIGKEKNLLSPQHKGLGKKLIREAEKITKREFGLRKISVISGVGARDYYRKLGYKLKNTYMVKKIS